MARAETGRVEISSSRPGAWILLTREGGADWDAEVVHMTGGRQEVTPAATLTATSVHDGVIEAASTALPVVATRHSLR